MRAKLVPDSGKEIARTAGMRDIRPGKVIVVNPVYT
jgi:hypothetical protein